MKRFERSNGLDTALYKNYLYLFFFYITVILMTVVFIMFDNSLEKLLWTCLFWYPPTVK